MKIGEKFRTSLWRWEVVSESIASWNGGEWSARCIGWLEPENEMINQYPIGAVEQFSKATQFKTEAKVPEKGELVWVECLVVDSMPHLSVFRVEADSDIQFWLRPGGKPRWKKSGE